MTVRLGIFGGNGRMGTAIAAVATSAGDYRVTSADHDDDPALLARNCDVLVDFSTPTALAAHLEAHMDIDRLLTLAR